MPRRDLRLSLLAGAVVVFFGYALIHLLLLRYQRGDVYPPYSTLRADPLGTRALYEALDATGAYSVSRGYLTLHRQLAEKPGALWYLGERAADLSSYSKEEVAALDAYVKNGGRVVITFQPEDREDSADTTPDKSAKRTSALPKRAVPPEASTPDPDAPPLEKQTQEERYERQELRREQASEDDAERRKDVRSYQRTLAALWGFGWEDQVDGKTERPAEDRDTDDANLQALRIADGTTEPKIPWTSGLFFVRIESPWNVEYYAAGRPVLMTRAWGNGTLIVATDSYFLSNEALRKQRVPKLISFLVGPQATLLFDETHLGTEEREGVMALAEKFRLEGYLLGAACVAGLFLWRNSIPLVPPRTIDSDTPVGGTVSGKDSRSGLINLLRRNIPTSEILTVCFGEWKRGVIPGSVHLQEKKSRMEAVLSASENQSDSVVETYHALREINIPGRAKGIRATKS